MKLSNCQMLVVFAGAAVAACGFVATSANAAPPTLELVLRRDPTVSNNPVPGVPGEVFASNGLGNPSIDGNGNIILRGTLDTSGAFGVATTANRQCVFYGGPASSANPIHLLARDGVGNLHLTNPNDWAHNSSATGGTGLVDIPVLSPNGTIFMSSSLWGTGATTTNNTAFWTGLDGSLALVAQRGFVPGPNGVAPGTAGALWNTNMNLGTSGLRCNNAGQVAFVSSLTGGDVSGTTNNDGLFVGSGAGIAMISRKGNQGLVTDSGPFADATLKTGATSTFGVFENNFGEIALVSPLLVGSGTTPVTTANDSNIWTTLGSGVFRSIAREGDPTPWDNTLTFKASSNPFGQLGQAMSQNRSYFTTVTLGGSVTTGVNDLELVKYHWDTVTSTGAWTPLFRKGDACPVVPGANWGGWNTTSTRCNSNDGMLLATILVDNGSATITNANDEALIYMSPTGSLQVAAREGALLTDFGDASNLPGLPSDARFDTSNGSGALTSGSQCQINSRGQILFSQAITGTGINGPFTNPNDFNNTCLFLWDPNSGLTLVAQVGTSFDPGTGPAMGLAQGLDINALATGEGTGLSLTDSGWIVFRFRDGFGNYAIYRTHVDIGQVLGSCCTNNTCTITTQASCAGTWSAHGTCTSSSSCAPACGSADFNCDGDIGTDSDIEAFFACLGGDCPPMPCISNADFNGDGDIGTDADIEAFFRVLAGGNC